MISNISYAEEKITIDTSQFIYNPTFSAYYDEKIYFIDQYDSKNYFKSFAINSNQNSYALSSYELDFDVIDAFSIKNLFFVLSSDSIKFADLSQNKTIFTSLNINTFEKNTYESIFIYNLGEEYIITLTPSKDSGAPALIYVYNLSTETISSCKITDSNLSDESLTISILATIKINDSSYCYIYFGGNTIKYHTISLTSNQTISAGPNEIKTSQLDTNSQTKIVRVNNIFLSDDPEATEYFLVSYEQISNGNTQYYSIIYSYDFSVISDPKFNKAALPEEIATINSVSPYIQTSGSFIVYPTENDGPEIVYKNISSITFIGGKIKNPKPTLNEYNTTEYRVMTTNQNTHLLENPWDSSSNINIPYQTDVLIVGVPLISDIEIDNLYYCLYTTKNSDLTYQNNYGYICADLLDEKSIVTLSDLNLASIVKVYPNTSLYSLPSKASDIILETDGKFSVEIVDLMKSYKTDTIEWIKVRIGNTLGYIDRSRINFSSDKVNFISTNATIIQDKTYVFSEANDSSSLIYNVPLNKGKAVYIDGVRDTKTGYTKIKFNDDYGNEFEGFVKTENLKSDNWSQLQIIGSVLIAINTGILILVLIFKNKKLGKSSKYQPDHTDNEVLN